MKVRQATAKDIEQYRRLQADRWSEDNRASDENLQIRLRVHPQGMLVAEEQGQVVGMVYAMRLAAYDYDNPPSWYEITNDGKCDTHVPGGNVIFGVDLSTARGVGGRAGDALLIGIARLAIHENVKWCMLGGRMPGYHTYKNQMSAEQYFLAKDKNGKYLDPQVNYYTSVPGLKAVKVLPEYFKDPESENYGVLLRWRNPFYNAPFPRLWSALFPVLFKLETAYFKLTRKLHSPA